MEQESKTRELLKPFHEIIKEIIPTIGVHLANLEISDNPADAQQAKVCWWRIRKQLDEFIGKVDKDIKSEIKASRKGKHSNRPRLHSTLEAHAEAGIPETPPMDYSDRTGKPFGQFSKTEEKVEVEEMPLMTLDGGMDDEEQIDEF